MKSGFSKDRGECSIQLGNRDEEASSACPNEGLVPAPLCQSTDGATHGCGAKNSQLIDQLRFVIRLVRGKVDHSDHCLAYLGFCVVVECWRENFPIATVYECFQSVECLVLNLGRAKTLNRADDSGTCFESQEHASALF